MPKKKRLVRAQVQLCKVCVRDTVDKGSKRRVKEARSSCSSLRDEDDKFKSLPPIKGYIMDSMMFFSLSPLNYRLTGQCRNKGGQKLMERRACTNETSEIVLLDWTTK